MSTPIIQNLLALPARGRQQLGTLRQRLFNSEKPKTEANFLRTSLSVHRPVWVTAGGAAYTTAVAAYLTMRYLRRVR